MLQSFGIEKLGMPILIWKVSSDLYSARLSIPDMPAVKAAWSTDEPLSADDLFKKLVDRGAHQVDIEDAFTVADRNWSDDSFR